NNLEWIDENGISISIYANNENAEKIEINCCDTQIQIEKILANDFVNYKATINMDYNDITQISLIARHDGLEALENVTENYQLEIVKDNEKKYKYQITNEITFSDSVEMEEFNEDNSIVLTDDKHSSETIENFIQAIKGRINEVNKSNAEKLGIKEDENLFYNLYKPITNIFYKLEDNEQNKDMTEKNETDILTFNEKYDLYKSNKEQGVTVKGLISTIENDIKLYEEDTIKYKIKEINLNGEEYKITLDNINDIKNKIDKDKNYRIETEKEETGIIYRIVISEVATTEE
ncbi:MAG: hypothetical protein HUJ68_11015, partial [Clostridia bacterium]|nr:hypothetical protein [Clostridia bacterium]